MISDLDETIKQLLIEKGGLSLVDVDIAFDMPDREWSGAISKPTVNIYLYDIHENLERRETDWAITHSNGKANRMKAPMRIDLSYLITVWTNDIADQHRLLGHILTTLARYREIPDELLQGDLSNAAYPIMAQTLQPDGVLRNSADFWSALDNNLMPTISYVVTIPVDLNIGFSAPEVRTKVLRFQGDGGQGPDEIILIGGAVHRKGKPDEVVPDATIVVKELQITTTTNREGVYAFRRMRSGKHTFEVTAPGEKMRQVSIIVPGANYDIAL
ncbi:Pvc16 family protein [Chloroflexota bacterium]